MFGAAERYELLLVPKVAGTHTMHVDWVHWVTGKVLGTGSIPVTAIAWRRRGWRPRGGGARGAQYVLLR